MALVQYSKRKLFNIVIIQALSKILMHLTISPFSERRQRYVLMIRSRL